MTSVRSSASHHFKAYTAVCVTSGMRNSLCIDTFASLPGADLSAFVGNGGEESNNIVNTL